MKIRQNLSHSHDVSEAATVSAYDGWRDNVTVTIRDDRENGTDEVTLDLPNNVFEKLVETVNKIVQERQLKLEDSRLE
jgi:VCBS repeat-containing protein